MTPERSEHQKRISAAMKTYWNKRKYGNVPDVVDGIRFASKREAHRYCELKLLEKAGELEALQLQPRFPLKVNGTLVCTYVADFSYHDVKTGNMVIEDAKGVKTREFILKSKLFRALHSREIILV